MKTGLTITTGTVLDRNILDVFFEVNNIFAEYDAKEDYFFIAEEEDNFEELENKLQKEFDNLEVNAKIEYVF